MVSNSEKAAYLTILQQEVDNLINESKSHHEKTNRYEALRNIIDLISQEEEFNLRFDEFSDMIISMAQLNFSHRLDVATGDDLFGYIATSLNLLNEELEHRAAPKHFLSEAMEMIPHPVLITDEKGIIQEANSLAESLTGFQKEELINTPVSNYIFSSAMENILENALSEQAAVLQSKSQQNINVIISSKEVVGPNDTATGIFISFKKAEA